MVVLGTGGPVTSARSRTCRAHNKPSNLLCMNKLVDDPAALIRYSIEDLVETTGSQGVEQIMWIAARGYDGIGQQGSQ